MRTHPNISSPLSHRRQTGLLALLGTDKNAAARCILRLAREGVDLDTLFDRDEAARVQAAEALRTPVLERMGFVYIAAYPAFPDLLKIGMTRRTPQARLSALTTAGIPGAFDLLHAREVLDAPAVEAEVHRCFKENRVERELFRVERETAIETLNAVASHDNLMLRRRLGQVLPPVLEVLLA